METILQPSDMNVWISFILRTVMTCHMTLVHVKDNFGPIQYDRHIATFWFARMDISAVRSQYLMSRGHGHAWTLSIFYIVLARCFILIFFGQRWPPCGQFHFPYFIWLMETIMWPVLRVMPFHFVPALSAKRITPWTRNGALIPTIRSRDNKPYMCVNIKLFP